MLKPRSHSWRNTSIFTTLKSLYSSTSGAFAPPLTPVDVLYRDISRAGDPRVSVAPIIDQYVQQGGNLVHHQLKGFIKELRKYKRYKHAFEISEWMSNKCNGDLTPGDLSIQLDLISKVHGLKPAEEYYESIPDGKRGLELYSSLLNCYAKNKCVDKAESVMQQMKDLGYMRNTLSYNVMLNMYSKMEMYDKLDILVQEMEEKGIEYDTYTYTIRLNACVSASDIEGMEKLLMKMELDPLVVAQWSWYITAANGYLIAGLSEKARKALKAAEKLITDDRRKNGYEILIGLYTKLEDKDEVYRIWSLYLAMNKHYNSGYLMILSSLAKLGDISGLEKIYEHWDLGSKTCFDIRLPNLMISKYCTHGQLENAKAIVDGLIQGGKDPNASSWDRLAFGYYTQNKMEEAVDSFKKALRLPRHTPWWTPYRKCLAGCLNFLIRRGDLETAEEIVKLLKERGYISSDSYNMLISHIRNDKPELVTFDNDELDGNIDDPDSKPLYVELL